MADECFGHPRLAAIYDPLDPARGDLDACLRIVEEFGARRILDIGCGTGCSPFSWPTVGSRSSVSIPPRHPSMSPAPDRAASECAGFAVTRRPCHHRGPTSRR
jgi:hypothetical protein